MSPSPRINDLTRAESHALYAEAVRLATREGKAQLRYVLRQLAKSDLFYLLVYQLNRPDIDNDWLYARCREVQADPDGYLDLWAREHYKSTIITFGLTIQDILNDPEITVGIFSHTRSSAKDFLKQIKTEFETNEALKELFSDILWANPWKEAPKWSMDDGLIVRRKTNPKEATIEAWGVVEGQPTGKHFKLLVYDDIVTLKSVTEQLIPKTTHAWSISLNLSAVGGRIRYIGTRYNYNDTYRTIIDRGAAKLRKHPATDNGKPDGQPVFMSAALLADKRKTMGSYVFACQMLQDPVADEAQGFKLEWLKYWKADQMTGFVQTLLLCDPASEKKKTSDYTCFMVVGLGHDKNYYIIDMIRDRLNLTERANILFALHATYSPTKVGYEKYGMQADIEHFQDRMERNNYRFPIIELGGPVGKLDRIRGLVPLFEMGRVYLPERCVRVDYQKKAINLTESFIHDEYLPFPVGVHDDMFDCLARINDPQILVKSGVDVSSDQVEEPQPTQRGSWRHQAIAGRYQQEQRRLRGIDHVRRH